jgi:hypothetical protein
MQPEFIYEFSEEFAVRVKKTLDGKSKVASLPCSVARNASDTDLVTATWPDGHTHEVPGLTVSRLKESSWPFLEHSRFVAWYPLPNKTQNRVETAGRPSSPTQPVRATKTHFASDHVFIRPQ